MLIQEVIKMKRKAFTLIELLVVVSIIALLISILLPGLNKAREAAYRIKCLTNMRALTQSWRIYAHDNDENLVFSCQRASAQETDESGTPTSEYSWLGNSDYIVAPPANVTEDWLIERVIEAGKMWKYCPSVENYRCPSSKEFGEVVTYTIISPMHGLYWPSAYDPAKADGMYNKKLTSIYNPSGRAVFIDEGKITYDDYGVYYSRPMWWDPPCVRHNKGETLSFADGHAEYWKWESEYTLEIAEQRRYNVLDPGSPDLEKWQRAFWGKLGYVPN